MWEAAVKIELMLGYAALAPRLPFSQWEATIRSSGSCSAVRCLLPSTSGSRQFRGLPAARIRMWEAIPIPLCGAVRLPDRRGICSALFRTPDTVLPEFAGAQIPLPFLPGLRQNP